jgi:hypothetical protein
VRRGRLQFDDKDAVQFIVSLFVEMPRDIEHLMQLRHEGQALLKLVESQVVDAGKITKKVVMEDSQPSVLPELNVNCDHSCPRV